MGSRVVGKIWLLCQMSQYGSSLGYLVRYIRNTIEVQLQITATKFTTNSSSAHQTTPTGLYIQFSLPPHVTTNRFYTRQRRTHTRPPESLHGHHTFTQAPPMWCGLNFLVRRLVLTCLSANPLPAGPSVDACTLLSFGMPIVFDTSANMVPYASISQHYILCAHLFIVYKSSIYFGHFIFSLTL